MFINDDGDWECSECGAKALMYGYHRPGCNVLNSCEHDCAHIDNSICGFDWDDNGVPLACKKLILLDKQNAQAMTYSMPF